MDIQMNEADEILIDNAAAILDEMGLDIETSIRVMLKRIVRDGNAAFLFDNKPFKVPPVNMPEEKKESSVSSSGKTIKMTKNKAIALFKNKGTAFDGSITFASKNKASGNYWANPLFNVLTDNWFLMLNDWSCQKIYLFKIPKNTFKAEHLIPRADVYKIDLQIMYDDNSFTDIRSKISFAKFLKDEISY